MVCLIYSIFVMVLPNRQDGMGWDRTGETLLVPDVHFTAESGQCKKNKEMQ